MFENWHKNYIEDVYVSQGTFITILHNLSNKISLIYLGLEWTQCPEGYVDLVNREWPGVQAGCYCPEKNMKKEALYFGLCDLKQTRRGCESLKPIKPRKLNHVNNSTICAKVSDTDFFHLSRPLKDGTCKQEGDRICGDVNGDRSIQSCIPKDKPCPVTDIKIEENDSEYLKDDTYEKYKLGNKKVLLVSRSSNNLPVVEFKLTEGAPCIEKNEYDFTKNRTFYKLLDRSYYKGCTTSLNEDLITDDR